MLRSLLVLIPLVSAAAGQIGPARHYSYSGNDPAHWTSSVLAPQDAASPADFTVFPCNAGKCAVARVATDANRNTYVVGSRYFQVQATGWTAPRSDVFVAKLDPAGVTLFLATFSGKGNDKGRAIALDAEGNLLIGGSTTSPNFPLRKAFQPELGVGNAGFLMKLSPDGSQLIYSTYFGGTAGVPSVNAIAADGAGAVYVTGQTARAIIRPRRACRPAPSQVPDRAEPSALS